MIALVPMNTGGSTGKLSLALNFTAAILPSAVAGFSQAGHAQVYERNGQMARAK